MSWFSPRKIVQGVYPKAFGSKSQPAAPAAPPMQSGQGGPTGAPRSFGSSTFDPTYMSPQGGTFSAHRPPGATGTQGQNWVTPPPQPGVLSSRGTGEQAFDDIKGSLQKPGAGEGMLTAAAGMLQGPNRTAGFADRNGGIFEQPGMAETNAAGALPGLRNKGYTEQLYESGNQGLNTFYDRELQKRSERLNRTMAASGMFGSGAMARSMFELEGDLGAQQARDMADLAVQGDTAMRGRTELGNTIAKTGQTAGEGRVTAGGVLQNTADASIDRQGRGLADVGGTLADKELDREKTYFDTGARSQGLTQDREHKPIDDALAIAGAKAGITERGLGKATDEDVSLGLEQIQTLINSGAIDAKMAETLTMMVKQGDAQAIQLIGAMAKGG